MELENLPLSFLISAPLNAAIEAQRAAALSAAAFIEQVGFLPKNQKLSLFTNATNTYDVRQAQVSYTHKEVVLDKAENLDADPPTPATYKLGEVTRTLQLPFISLLQIPLFEVSELNIDFSVRLKGVTQFEAEFNNETSTNVESQARGSGDLTSLGVPIAVGGSMKVQTASQSKFGLRYGEGHEAEYNMHVTVKAIQAPPPKGIERLLALAEKIVDASERSSTQLKQQNEAAKAELEQHKKEKEEEKKG
jgi:hypothetical protein